MLTNELMFNHKPPDLYFDTTDLHTHFGTNK